MKSIEDDIEKTCIICGNKFFFNKKKYCSEKCRNFRNNKVNFERNPNRKSVLVRNSHLRIVALNILKERHQEEYKFIHNVLKNELLNIQ